MDGQLTIQFGGRDLQLLPEHAVWCRESQTVWIADLHLGKEQLFRHAGIPVPDLLADDLSRLSRILSRTSARQVYVLGDLIHARAGRSDRLNETLANWRIQHDPVAITLVRGNHDLRAGDPPSNWRMHCVNSPLTRAPFTLTHEPLFDNKNFNLAGHLHPKWRIQSRAEAVKLPCFLLRHQTLVLPAFGRFIDHGVIDEQQSDEIYAIAEGEVISTKRA